MQREKLSAMMDGEVLDLELVNAISRDSTLKTTLGELSSYS